MATTFSTLPIIDVGILGKPGISSDQLRSLSNQLYDTFATTGFAYLTNVPLSFDHGKVFQIARKFFGLSESKKMALAKRSFCPGNTNTYRGYFPTQPHLAVDNLKEGFEIGPPGSSPGLAMPESTQKIKINLSEPNVWPNAGDFDAQTRLERMHGELQAFASRLLSLLAIALGKNEDFFSPYLDHSLSTLRLLHYPPVSVSQTRELDDELANRVVRLSCTPHTDSGILTLLHQDATGGLEVLNAAGEWIAAPYVRNSVVVNIGDLMAKVSGGRFTATVHRVRAPIARKDPSSDGFGRFSIPFFFEPGENCVVRSIDEEDVDTVVYGEHVRKKMAGWAEFQEDSGYDTGTTEE